MAGVRSPFHISVLMPVWIVRAVFMLVPLVLDIVFLVIYANSKDALSKAGVTFANRPSGEVKGYDARQSMHFGHLS